jgi:hypothetical protein
VDERGLGIREWGVGIRSEELGIVMSKGVGRECAVTELVEVTREQGTKPAKENFVLFVSL